jgi:SAM-dependent methyltransferase
MSDPVLAPLAASFGRVADAYDRGRPSYPPEALRWLTSELGLTAESTVLDLAAGTGKLTAGLRPLVGRVIAVEPVAEMRRVLEAAQPLVDVRAGTAEAIPLESASVDGVLVAAAFHWFAPEPALAEIHRVLRPGGGLGLLWNRPEWDAEPWYPDFAVVLEQARSAQGGPPNLYSVGPWRAALERSPLYGPVRKREFRHVHRVGREEFLARVASWSVVAVLPEERRSELLAEVGAMLDGRGLTMLDLRYRTDTYRARAHQSPSS